ncbi:hypothetical protein [Phycicoccus avicenniae]|uniref:hypothetical protein n=1 Tax=Phycicoccus avicenniae TaxID=2828860 RepID=UPI003D2B649E
MQVNVVRVADSLVECDSPAGRLVGIWRSGTLPVVGQVHDVELDLLGRLEWGSHVDLDDRIEGIHGSDVVGRVEGVDGECVTIRVAGAVVLLGVLGDPPLAVVGKRVAVTPAGLALYPTGV